MIGLVCDRIPEAHLLVDVAQPLVLGVHNLEDCRLLEDSTRWHSLIGLERVGSARRLGWPQPSTHVQEGWSASWVLLVQTRLRVSSDGSSTERPEVLRARVLPVIPNLVNHL